MIRRTGALTPAALLFALAAAGCAGSEVATAPAERRDFVHRVRAEGNLEAVESTVLGVPDHVRWRARIAWMEEDGARVEAGDLVLRFDPTEMEQELQNAEGDLAKNSHELDRSRATSNSQIAELDKQSEIADHELEVSERFRFEDDEVFSRNEIIESRIDGELARTRKEHATSVSGIQEQLAETELGLVDISRRRALQRIGEARDGLAALEVRAPHDGLLIWTRDWNGEIPKLGSEVHRNNELGRLPRLEDMNARVFVLEADAGGIEPGLQATITVESRPEISIPATVASVDAVSQARFRGSPVRTFGVTLRPDTSDPRFMKPGQRVSALIWIEQRPEAVVVPRQAIHRDEESTWVWVRRAGGFERVEVEVGPRSVAEVVVESGLEGGERVALEEPASTPRGGFLAELLSPTDPDAAADDGGVEP